MQKEIYLVTAAPMRICDNYFFTLRIFTFKKSSKLQPNEIKILGVQHIFQYTKMVQNREEIYFSYYKRLIPKTRIMRFKSSMQILSFIM